MRSNALMLAAGLIALLLFPGAETACADTPAQLPDLSVTPEDIWFSYYDDPLDYGLLGLPVDIGVWVHNAGPGNSSSANVSLYIDGSFVAVLHVMKNLTTEYPDNMSGVHFTWDTSNTVSGNHTVRAVANDTAGDAAPGDNMAETVFRIYKNIPAAVLSVSPTHVEAVVTPSNNAVVRFTGWAEVDLGEWDEATLSLTASVDQGWAASLAPNAMVFTSGDRQDFNVTIVVPAASSAAIPGSLRVDGRLRAGSMLSSSTAQTIVTVRPYYNLSVESDNPEKELGIDGVGVLKVKVWNRGNGVDSYNVKVENLDQLKEAGWDVIVEADTILRVTSDDLRILKITVRAPNDWSVYENNLATIKLKISSVNAADREENVSARYTMVVRERGFNMPCLISAIAVSAVIIVAAVAAVMYRKGGKNKEKSVKDYLKELNIDEGD